ncbi:MAG: indole-3-glycerol-phosphate synthase TrpC, partial [Gammaproteobacteria bacterium]|nr:indole-3-glycerol-phosphate synthase TrpC [Gammaproteobacteria bacterium]
MTPKTPDILIKILNRKREEITERSQKIALRDLVPQIPAASPVRGFVKSIEDKLAANHPAVISEIK